MSDVLGFSTDGPAIGRDPFFSLDGGNSHLAGHLGDRPHVSGRTSAADQGTIKSPPLGPTLKPQHNPLTSISHSSGYHSPGPNPHRNGAGAGSKKKKMTSAASGYHPRSCNPTLDMSWLTTRPHRQFMPRIRMWWHIVSGETSNQPRHHASRSYLQAKIGS